MRKWWWLLFISTKTLAITIGTTYPIAETSVITLLQQRSAEVIAHINHVTLTPVANLTRTQAPRAWLFNPAVTVAGKTINPLTTTALPEPLAFYDARDSRQVAWAQRIYQKYHGKVMLILVGGDVTQQAHRVYFDQQGTLTQRFHLQHVPALITQSGVQLKIAELVP